MREGRIVVLLNLSNKMCYDFGNLPSRNNFASVEPANSHAICVVDTDAFIFMFRGIKSTNPKYS